MEPSIPRPSASPSDICPYMHTHRCWLTRINTGVWSWERQPGNKQQSEDRLWVGLQTEYNQLVASTFP